MNSIVDLSFHISNLRPITLNDGNLKFRAMTLTYFEMFLNNLCRFLFAYIRLAIGIIFKLIGCVSTVISIVVLLLYCIKWWKFDFCCMTLTYFVYYVSKQSLRFSVGLYNKDNFQVNWIVATMSFQFSNLCTIALNDGNLTFHGMTLTYFEITFLYKLYCFLLDYTPLAFGIMFKLMDCYNYVISIF